MCPLHVLQVGCTSKISFNYGIFIKLYVLKLKYYVALRREVAMTEPWITKKTKYRIYRKHFGLRSHTRTRIWICEVICVWVFLCICTNCCCQQPTTKKCTKWPFEYERNRSEKQVEFRRKKCKQKLLKMHNASEKNRESYKIQQRHRKANAKAVKAAIEAAMVTIAIDTATALQACGEAPPLKQRFSRRSTIF